MKYTILIVLLAGLCGCASVVKSPSQVAKKTIIQYDQKTALYTVYGMGVYLDKWDTKFYQLCAEFDENGNEQSIYLWVNNESGPSGGLTYLTSATDIDGTELNLKQIKNQYVPNPLAGPGRLREWVTVELTWDYINKHKDTGMHIIINCKNGKLHIEIPSAYIQGFTSKYALLKQNTLRQ